MRGAEFAIIIHLVATVSLWGLYHVQMFIVDVYIFPASTITTAGCVKKLVKCKIFRLERKKLLYTQCNFTHRFVAKQLFSRIYALPSVKFFALKLRLCKKERQISGMIAHCANCGRHYIVLHLRLTTKGALLSWYRWWFFEVKSGHWKDFKVWQVESQSCLSSV